MTIPPDKQYENLTTHLRYLNDQMLGAFNHFITLASAIIGGSLYVHVTLAADDSRRENLGHLATALLSLVGIGCIVLILTNLFAWLRYRETLSAVFPEIPASWSWTAWFAEALMCVLIVLTCVGFGFLNPL